MACSKLQQRQQTAMTARAENRGRCALGYLARRRTGSVVHTVTTGDAKDVEAKHWPGKGTRAVTVSSVQSSSWYTKCVVATPTPCTFTTFHTVTHASEVVTTSMSKPGLPGVPGGFGLASAVTAVAWKPAGREAPGPTHRHSATQCNATQRNAPLHVWPELGPWQGRASAHPLHLHGCNPMSSFCNT